jgi:hypothetical protein
VDKKPKTNEQLSRDGERRLPSKGALAAERASAGLGTSDDDGATYALSPGVDLWSKPARKPAGPSK